jgi:hypothetical protein
MPKGPHRFYFESVYIPDSGKDSGLFRPTVKAMIRSLSFLSRIFVRASY